MELTQQINIHYEVYADRSIVILPTVTVGLLNLFCDYFPDMFAILLSHALG